MFSVQKNDLPNNPILSLSVEGLILWIKYLIFNIPDHREFEKEVSPFLHKLLQSLNLTKLKDVIKTNVEFLRLTNMLPQIQNFSDQEIGSMLKEIVHEQDEKEDIKQIIIEPWVVRATLDDLNTQIINLPELVMYPIVQKRFGQTSPKGSRRNSVPPRRQSILSNPLSEKSIREACQRVEHYLVQNDPNRNKHKVLILGDTTLYGDKHLSKFPESRNRLVVFLDITVNAKTDRDIPCDLSNSKQLEIVSTFFPGVFDEIIFDYAVIDKVIHKLHKGLLKDMLKNGGILIVSDKKRNGTFQLNEFKFGGFGNNIEQEDYQHNRSWFNYGDAFVNTTGILLTICKKTGKHPVNIR
jgi:hypothetical protein